MTIHLKRVNRFDSGSGGGGGGDVTVKGSNYYIEYGENNLISAQNLYVRTFNVDNNKAVFATGGYGGGLSIRSFRTSSITTLSTINSDNPITSNICIAEDDSFFVYRYNNNFCYVPVNSNYTAGTVISVDITTLGYSNNIRTVFILSPTRFGFYDYTNNKVGIIKLENGALVDDKSIDVSSFSVQGEPTYSFSGKIVLLIGSTSSPKKAGIKIIDPDTEETIYEDVRDDNTNYPHSCCVKDNYIFVYNSLNQTPYVTDPIVVYEYSNGQFSKKTMSTIGYTPRQYSNTIPISVYKQSEGVYIVYGISSFSNGYLDISMFVCDMTTETIEGNFYNSGGLSVFSIGLRIVTVDNEPRLIVSTSVYQSYTTFYILRYGNYHLDKLPTTIEWNNNTYGLTAVGS